MPLILLTQFPIIDYAESMIKKGDIVKLKPAYQDPGDGKYTWQAIEDEDGDRVRIMPINTKLSYPPNYVVKVDWLEDEA